MYILAGLKKSSKPKSFIGLFKCSNCKEITNFYLYEYSVRPTIFFIPTIKIKSKHHVACSYCEHGLPVPNYKVSDFVTLEHKLPSPHNVISLFDRIHRYVVMDDSRLMDYLMTNDPEEVSLRRVVIGVENKREPEKVRLPI